MANNPGRSQPNIAPDQKVVIGIPTFRRPQGLERLLISIAAQRVFFTPKVVVADNQGEAGAGIKVVEEIRNRGDFPFPLMAIAVAERGISQVRNALLNKAFAELKADVLVMVDDDEYVEADWLANMVSMQEKFDFDVVRGKVLPEFAHNPPGWCCGLDIYYKQPDKAAGGPVSIVYATDNVLINKTVFTLLPTASFDPAFGLSGGGDAEFFTRLKKRGATFGYAPRAISHELIHADRMTRRWALQRFYRIGSGDARIFKMHSESLSDRCLFFAKMAGAFIVAPLLALLTFWSPARQMRALALLFRQVGKLNGLFGRAPQVYQITHGS